jgi:alkanesulfonate monooxygenase SsuD/methylene tetrahydromethanopterin reductase-like flavin-dependent oxidoreductase (luciferase family)
VQVAAAHSARFEGLFRNVGEVRNGFAEPPDLQQMAVLADDQVAAIRDGMILGTPDEVVARLKQYQAVGVDQFCYGASFGLPHAVARRSLELFITDVMPQFATHPLAQSA